MRMLTVLLGIGLYESLPEDSELLHQVVFSACRLIRVQFAGALVQFF